MNKKYSYRRQTEATTKSTARAIPPKSIRFRSSLPLAYGFHGGFFFVSADNMNPGNNRPSPVAEVRCMSSARGPSFFHSPLLTPSLRKDYVFHSTLQWGGMSSKTGTLQWNEGVSRAFTVHLPRFNARQTEINLHGVSVFL